MPRDGRIALTGDLDAAHGRIVGALSLIAAAAREDLVPRGDTATTRAAVITDTHGAVDTLASHLAARARDDLTGAVLSGQSYEPRLSGSPVVPVDPHDDMAGTVSLTSADRAVDRLRLTTRIVMHDDGRMEEVRALEGQAIDSPTFAAVVRTFATLADHLERRTGTDLDYQDAIDAMKAAGRILVDLYQRITPTGARCSSIAHDDDGRRVQCERTAVGGAHCDKCWPLVRSGFPPDAPMLRDWNSRLDRDCTCTSTVCIAADDHMPGSCTTRIPAGEPKRTCGTCVQRLWRARRHEKAARGPAAQSSDLEPRKRREVTTSDGRHAFGWNDPT